jgi:hypothetical protein
MAGELLLNGQNVPVTVFVGQNKYGEDKLVSLKVREKVTKHEDQHLNQPRAQHDKQVDGYKANVQSHMANGSLMQALLDQQAQRDANLPIDPISVAFSMKTRDGAAPKAWALTNVTTEFSLDVSARNKRVLIDLDCDCDDLVTVVK